MSRRNFLKIAAATPALALAAPSIVSASPQINWRLTSSFPNSLDILYNGATEMADLVSEMTDGAFRIQVFTAGEIVPALSALDAVSNDTVEMCQTGSHYYMGKDPTFLFGSTFPFGLPQRLQNAWYYHAGGSELLNKFYSKWNVIGLLSGNTGAQMGGWFRKEINSLEDLNGLKFRVAGVGGEVLSRLGVVPQLIAGGDIYPALERGTIDAAEWIGPYDDSKLGFHKIAPYYYYPGWWENSTAIQSFINLDKWNELPATYQAALRAAATAVNTTMMARYDASNGAALQKLTAEGAQLRSFPMEIVQRCYEVAQEVMNEKAAQNAEFKEIYDHLLEFRRISLAPYQITEGTATNILAQFHQKGLL